MPGERGKLLFPEKEVSLSPPGPLSPFKKNGVLWAPVGRPGYVARGCLRWNLAFGYVARGRSADATPLLAGRDKPLDAAREVFVLLNKRGVF